MGGSQSSEKSTDIEASGQVNNQFVVRSPVDVQSIEILTVLTILCALRILEVAYGLYATCKRRILHRIRDRERIRLTGVQIQRSAAPAAPIGVPRPSGSNQV